MHLADEVGRNLAGAEAGHANLRRDALHFLLDPRLDVGGGDGQHEGALQALVLSLDSLDGHVAQFPMNSWGRSHSESGWCARRDLNPHIFRYWNLNPARLPVPPRARGPRGAAYSKDARAGNPQPQRPEVRSSGKESDSM